MNKKGFTLIELLVVIVILAIIALITVPNALAMITTAQQRSDARSVEGVRRAIEVICLKNATRSAGETAIAYTLATINAELKTTVHALPNIATVPIVVDSSCNLTSNTHVQLRNATGATYIIRTGAAV